MENIPKLSISSQGCIHMMCLDNNIVLNDIVVDSPVDVARMFSHDEDHLFDCLDTVYDFIGFALQIVNNGDGALYVNEKGMSIAVLTNSHGYSMKPNDVVLYDGEPVILRDIIKDSEININGYRKQITAAQNQ